MVFIIDTLEPMISSGKFVCHEELIEADWYSVQKYASDVRKTFSLFWQLARITRERGALIHDDRLDAVAGSARYWVEALSIDNEKAAAAAKNEAYRKMMQDPLGNGRPMPGFRGGQFGSFSEPSALTRHGLGRIDHLKRVAIDMRRGPGGYR